MLRTREAPILMSAWQPKDTGLSIEPGTGRLLALHMTAQAHFMQHRYTGFDEPLRIVPPTATQP